MKSSIAILSSLMLVQPAPPQTAVQKVDNRLTELLAPGTNMAPIYSAGPIAWKPSRHIENIPTPVQPYSGAPPHLKVSARAPVKLRVVPEALPLAFYFDQPAVPKGSELPTQPLIWLPSVDVNAPAPIPILALPQKDRASLADPALEASLDAALQPLAPVRRDPVPFTPINLPDPFENVRAGQLRNPPEENPMPPR